MVHERKMALSVCMGNVLGAIFSILLHILYYPFTFTFFLAWPKGEFPSIFNSLLQMMAKINKEYSNISITYNYPIFQEPLTI